ncbi:helicase-related protein [Saccharospirillum mangrovi]|uniref:helicase-related protein n=1 Tax=Saccharospirillum mangrovi TaxID=2161747 RepID=UPI000D3D5EBE|nr:helicase-related protein [Saccharospirillum mangrovi]
MSEFMQGQRWLADGEPELGLGLVQSVDARTVTLYFPSADDERCYALREPPLTRIRFDVGDRIERRDQGETDVIAVHELKGLLVYETEAGMVPESELADRIDHDNPLTRLLTGQTDHPNWFAFRSALSNGHQAIWNQHLNGLLGTRSSLLPHQLYVAFQATQHSRVRALLSDEVGLGKTIEAGLIINRLRQQGRASRVLIAVPDALQAQWLVELVRRFAIQPEFYQFSDHDFGLGQVHLIPHSLLSNAEEMAWVTAQEWDMLVVDEAHHLDMAEPDEADVESSWLTIAQRAPHLLLLTATPEQLGQQAHFQRLQLLDASRFASFDQYRADEAHFLALSDLAQALYQDRVDDALIQQLKTLGIEWHDDRMRALNEVLDRHGPGRVVYRNTRRGVSGFQRRSAEAHPADSDTERRRWLVDWLKQHRDQKVLLIAQHAEVAQELAHSLWHDQGIEATAFHEGLNLIERDRAAAHFASDDGGAQILVCSEIGGEGRNFQFCHHLVLWDMPDHPDVLEQRIGRLDRIGQTDTVHIHLPYLSDSDDEHRFRWFHEVLNCVEQHQPAAGQVHAEYGEQWLADPDDAVQTEQIKAELERLNAELEQGRDVMLELNSCRQPEADELAVAVAALEQHSALDVVEQAANLLNLHFEAISTGVYELIPSDKMLIPVIPGIPEGGALVCFERDTALAREDVHFVSWEHPLVLGLLDLVTGSQLGQASVALLETKQVPAGQLLLETQWRLSIPERSAHALRPHLDTGLLRTLTLEGGRSDLSQTLGQDVLQAQVSTLPIKTVRKLVQSAKERIPPLFDIAQGHAKTQFDQALANARASLAATNQARIERLQYLAGVNPLVTDQDVVKAQMQAELLDAAWDQVELQPAGIRLILCAPPGSL